MFWKIVARAKAFLGECKRDNISAYAAQSAFFIIMSIIPFAMLFISLIQYTPVTKSMVMEIINRLMPEYISPFLIGIIHEVYNNSVGIVSVSAIMAVWPAAKGIQCLTDGLNSVYDIEETRNWVFLRFRAILYTLMLVAAIVVSLTLMVFGNSLQNLIAAYIPFVANITKEILKCRSLILLAMMMVFFLMVYKMLPNRKAPVKNQLPGSIMSAVGWSLLSFGISVYVDYFNGFSMYGSLTTIILVMMWLYFGVYILLVCAEVNKMYEEYQSGKV
ncbi:MAG: YihY/virulence factor BrkB family protein [Lachnospiraceae bacterium]|jgi:membrane protein|nr:YihY/virulence factor BrkB family protein [Lachnospiraceae bacterium]